MIDAAIYKTISFEQITDISSAVGLTDAKVKARGVIYALIQVTGSDMRYRTDGEDPETGIGHYIATNGTVEVWGQPDMSAFRAIEVTSTSKLEVTYFGGGA